MGWVLDGKIYFVGGWGSTGSHNIAERYDPEANTWETLSSMSFNRIGLLLLYQWETVCNWRADLSSVEIYDIYGILVFRSCLPSEVNHGAALTVNGKIYLIGGRNSSINTASTLSGSFYKPMASQSKYANNSMVAS